MLYIFCCSPYDAASKNNKQGWQAGKTMPLAWRKGSDRATLRRTERGRHPQPRED
jgi:hypothetical protein